MNSLIHKKFSLFHQFVLSLIIIQLTLRPIIEKIRNAMLGADVLMIEDYDCLEQNICENFPFPEKREKYDTSVLLAILKIESRRNQCMITATTTGEISSDFLMQSQRSGIIFIK